MAICAAPACLQRKCHQIVFRCPRSAWHHPQGTAGGVLQWCWGLSLTFPTTNPPPCLGAACPTAGSCTSLLPQTLPCSLSPSLGYGMALCMHVNLEVGSLFSSSTHSSLLHVSPFSVQYTGTMDTTWAWLTACIPRGFDSSGLNLPPHRKLMCRRWSLKEGRGKGQGLRAEVWRGKTGGDF